jgi:hypothetical protein
MMPALLPTATISPLGEREAVNSNGGVAPAVGVLYNGEVRSRFDLPNADDIFKVPVAISLLPAEMAKHSAPCCGASAGS